MAVSQPLGTLLAERASRSFVGREDDGRGRSYRVPAHATRLFLGSADGYLYEGHPGLYDNNDGELTVTVDVAGG